MRDNFRIAHVQVLLRTKAFQIKGSLFLFFSLKWFRSFCFLSLASVQLRQPLSTCQGNGRGRTGAVALVSAVSAAAAAAGLPWPGLFPWDDIIPFSELTRTFGAQHTGSSHFLAKGSEISMYFANQISFYLPALTSSCTCSTVAEKRQFSMQFFALCVCVCVFFLGHPHPHVCWSDCYAAQLVCDQPLTFLDNASFCSDIETLQTASRNSSDTDELYSLSCTQISGLRPWRFQLPNLFSQLLSYKALLEHKKTEEN